jgi:hypothetical protein
MAEKPLPKNVSSSITSLRRAASFVFTGRVEREASSSLSSIPASSATVVVRVEHIYDAPRDLQNQIGQEVTVIHAEGSAPENGNQRRLFFTEPVAYGETVGVREIGSVADPGDRDAVEELVAHVRTEMDEQRLQQHIASADAVIHGKVIDVRSAEIGSARRFSEHDPEWWIATISILRSFKGDLNGNIAVRYPHSSDVRWYTAPKPEAGQEEIFVLHRDGLMLDHAALAILHPTDMLGAEPEELNRLSRLV